MVSAPPRGVFADLISSCSAILFPMAELIALCKEFNKLVLVDGAHAPGQVPLQLETLGADFFTGTLPCYTVIGINNFFVSLI